MDGEREVAVLRLGHRPGRDDRMTTHVGLTARALGADRVLFAADTEQPVETVREVTDRFGGPFEATLVDGGERVVREWDGVVVHLTMYGEPVQAVVEDIRTDDGDGETDDGNARTDDGDAPLLVVVGSEKVPFDVYRAADYNVGVTNQPHSEVAALAVFLDRLFEGRELDREWTDARRVVVPKEAGKLVVPADDAEDGDLAEDADGTPSEDADDRTSDE